MILDVIENSMDRPAINMSQEVSQATEKLRSFMFERVYMGYVAQKQEEKARYVLENLYDYFMKHPDALPAEYRSHIEAYGIEQVVCDYIAGMTDRYALRMFYNLFIPLGC
jgi:dGTP triphosphohydrolase